MPCLDMQPLPTGPITFSFCRQKPLLRPKKPLIPFCIPDDTLVAGALLGGHTYHEGNSAGAPNNQVVELNGRTTPWNTLAIWKVSMLALTGFPLVSDGIVTDDATEPSFGVEEVVTIALLQRY
jgi:hypothetical protein